MKMLKRLLQFGLVVIFTMVVGGSELVHAFSTNDLEGIWHLLSLNTPKNDGADDFSYGTGVFTFQSDGSLTGTITEYDGQIDNISGTSSISEDGAVTWNLSDGGSITTVMNTGKDVMSGNYQETNELGLVVFVKKGSFYSTSDLEGTWYLRSLSTQKNGQPDNFSYDTGTFTFQSDGSFAGTMTDNEGNSWDESGTSSVSGDGVVTWNFNGGGSWSAVMNMGKDVMAENSQNTDYLVLDVFVKSDSNATIHPAMPHIPLLLLDD